MNEPEIIESYPPNIAEIRRYIDTPPDAIFAYGGAIYNPSKHSLYPDIIHHEKVHLRQQQEYTSPEIWWAKYLLDRNFRLEAEQEAYGEQYLWLKEKGFPGKMVRTLLEEMANALSSHYNLDITYHQAESLIRHYEKG